jgi:hypothetical protein
MQQLISSAASSQFQYMSVPARAPYFFLGPAALIYTKSRPIWTWVFARGAGRRSISQYMSPGSARWIGPSCRCAGPFWGLRPGLRPGQPGQGGGGGSNGFGAQRKGVNPTLCRVGGYWKLVPRCQPIAP